MPEAFRVPIGLRLNEVARMVARAFDDALAHAGGTLPVWLIMLNVKARRPTNQRELAEAVGVREATLTHHLNGMDACGLVTRVRKPGNRRVQVVQLTEAGEEAFLWLRETATSFDARLKTGLAGADLRDLDRLLGALTANADDGDGDGGTTPPWAGLASL